MFKSLDCQARTKVHVLDEGSPGNECPGLSGLGCGNRDWPTSGIGQKQHPRARISSSTPVSQGKHLEAGMGYVVGRSGGLGGTKLAPTALCCSSQSQSFMPLSTFVPFLCPGYLVFPFTWSLLQHNKTQFIPRLVAPH